MDSFIDGDEKTLMLCRIDTPKTDGVVSGAPPSAQFYRS
jgi:hypothetical protein